MKSNHNIFEFLICNRIKISITKSLIKFINLPKELKYKREKFKEEIYFIEKDLKNFPTPEIYLGTSTIAGKGFCGKNIGPFKILLKNLEKRKTEVYFSKIAKKHFPVTSLFENILHIKLILNSISPLHSTTLSYNDFCISLSAWQDTGKSSTSIHLLKNKKFRYVSDDRTYVDTNGMVYPFPVELKKISRLPYILEILLPRFPKIVRKILGKIRTKRIEPQKEDKVKPLKYLFLLERGPKKFFEEITINEAIPYLIQNLAYEIRLDENNLVRQYFYANKIDFLSLYEMWKKNLMHSLSKVKIFRMRGNSEYFSNQILNVISNK